MVDNTQNILFSGGVGYIKNRVAHPGIEYFNENFLIVAGSYTHTKSMSFGVSISKLEQSLVSESYDQFDMSFGWQYIYNQQLIWGLAFQNMMNKDESIPVALRLKKQIQGGAQWFFNEKLRFRFDIKRLLDSDLDNKNIYLAGLESQLAPYFVIRLGMRQDTVFDADFASLSLSFKGPRLNVDYTVEKGVKNRFEQMHSVDFRVPIW